MSQFSISQLEEDTFLQILTWVEEVVEGKGASFAQMMVSTVLGLIPFVGQAADAYNILRCLYQLSRTPDSNEHWLDLVLSLIALVPGFGDALKNVCNMLRHGKPMGRILDSLPRHVRGDIETWFRTLDWARYTAELIQNLDAILQGLGVGVVPDYMVREPLQRGDLLRLPFEPGSLAFLSTNKYLLYMPTRYQTKAMATLIDFVLQYSFGQGTTANIP